MEKLIILDYVACNVDIYDVDHEIEDLETYISDMGYNINDCAWMSSNHMQITYHKEILDESE